MNKKIEVLGLTTEVYDEATFFHLFERQEILYVPKRRITVPSYFCFDSPQELIDQIKHQFQNRPNKH